MLLKNKYGFELTMRIKKKNLGTKYKKDNKIYDNYPLI
jgi:hypothetical protein